MKKILIVGMGGQLGFELVRSCPGGCRLVAPTVAELDITDRAAVINYVTAEKPAAIINCAAYTAVDKAESEPDKAFAVNQTGPQYLAEAAKETGALLVHISTDFVFSGAQGRPYRPDDQPNPLSVYGKSKLAGENEVLASGARALIIRTAWLYSSHGNNFVKTMLRLMGERDSLGVVADQTGTPTWAASLAELIWRLIDKQATGTLHWSDAGTASWYDFAVAIYEEATALGLLNRPVQIKPITTADYPTPAARPACSVLDKSAAYAAADLQPVHWRANLRKMLTELKPA
ncbi:MAG: dTDP-4-dehydrorhamnose reductase [Candidatus Riflebacteria bacterium HGW-Riflebacteria-2]|jgi:dTDP-4-dehydrorhamnose reductase|nr:MAG: dTDP-4-dehydrorhamnose reductase [Candidatus Riflebacteria bacterium HGW-Riflebacteria-2]